MAEITLAGEPGLLLVRVDRREWEVPAIDRENIYVACAEEEYEVVSVCGFSDQQIAAQRWAGTIFENPELILEPCEYRIDPQTTAEVSGTMAQPGRVFFGGVGQFGSTPNWSFHLQVSIGTYDLFASDDYREVSARTGRVLRRLDQRITASSTLGTLDLRSEGEPTGTVAISVAGKESDDVVQTSTVLVTDRSRFTLATVDGEVVHTLPDSFHDDSNEELFLVVAARSGITRYVMSPLAPSRMFELLPSLEPAGLSESGYTWAQIPTIYSSLTFVAHEGRRRNTTTVTRGWLDAHPTNKIGPDWDVPGFLPEWIVSQPAYLQMSIHDARDEVTRVSAVSRTMN